MKVIQIIISIITFPLLLLAYILIKIYKLIISPSLPKCCIFYPTCSTYMLIALKDWGLICGFWLGMKRIMRCNPKNSHGGIDYVPINIKGDHKWIF